MADGLECEICVSPLEGEEAHQLSCGHTFHLLCIQDWMLKIAMDHSDKGSSHMMSEERVQPTCPYCRAPMDYLDPPPGEAQIPGIHVSIFKVYTDHLKRIAHKPSRQCNGLTKKGTRCTKLTKAGDYCHLHSKG